MPKETQVLIKPPDLPWEQVGTGQFEGITPENINLEADGWGPSNATFDLRREPDAPALDLSAGAEIEVYVASVLVWDGFVSSTPKKRTDLLTSVVCRGWQDELDGKVFTAGYVHNNMAEWKDMRSPVGADLVTLTTLPKVNVGDGGIALSYPQNIVPVGRCGVMLDLGPGQSAERIRFDWTITANAGTTRAFYAGSSNSPNSIAESTAQSAGTGAATVANSVHNAPGGTPRRYWFLFFDANTTAPAADMTVQISNVRVFAKAAYDSGGTSILKADVVVKDALTKGTLALSSDFSGIDPTSFNIPSLWLDPKGITARELISKVNAYHNWTAKMVPGKRFIFTARSTAPKVKVGEWSGLANDDDASANDITEIYNHCRATSTEPGGQLVVVDRYSKDQGGTDFVPSSPSLPNPSFDTNTAGWTFLQTGTRDTGDFDTSPASCSVTSGLGAWGATAPFSGTFKAGTPYTIRGRAKVNFGGVTSITMTVGDGSLDYISDSQLGTVGVWQTLTVVWTPKADTTGQVQFSSGDTSFRVDSVTMTVNQPTVLDKRYRMRSMILDASAALPADGVALTQLADTWLAAHMSTPFKGEQAVQGAQSIRDYLTGDDVEPARLLAMTGDLLHFDDRNNPDTGDIGRDGRLVKVAYEPLTDIARSDVDSTRTDVAALLSRIGVLAGGF